MTSLRSDKFGKFYVTTSIAYVNAPPHLGFALESVEADVLARARRVKGKRVFFLTGADEHGAKVARAAETCGEKPQAFVDEQARRYRELREILNLTWDDFIRTSDRERHWPNVRQLWRKLEGAGDLYRKKYRGLYCVGHEAFVTEKDLINGACRDHQAKPEVIEEENWFFRLSKYGPRVRELIASNELRIVPETRAREVTSFIDQGLEDISFSRPSKDLSWGIPVPDDPTQTIYVWADALANYLYPKEYWPADVHVIGKDILRFHALFWPAMLLSAGIELPKSIFVHGHITVEGQKMSKTIGNVIDPFLLVEKYGTDPVRYYLLREIPAYDDGDFSYRKFEERYNGDLANGLGNFAARVLTLAERDCSTQISADDAERCVEPAVSDKIRKTKEIVAEKLEEFRFHEALAAIWELIAFGDGYVNEKKPWENRDRGIIFNLVAILDNVAGLLAPFLPDSSRKITESIRWDGGKLEIRKGKPLFPRL